MNKEQLLEFQVSRAFSVLSRNLLTLLEDLQTKHNINFEKLYSCCDSRIIGMADYFDSKHYTTYRKKILDNCNAVKRDLEQIINEIKNISNENNK